MRFFAEGLSRPASSAVTQLEKPPGAES
jgi:hypothetical protein